MDVLAFRRIRSCKKAGKRQTGEPIRISRPLPDALPAGTSLSADRSRKTDPGHIPPLCVEMEGAAIAQAAYLNKVSCVIIRAISDKADNSAVMDYPAFEKQAIAHSVALVRELMRSL